MSLLAKVRWASSAVRSRGVGYEPQPLGRSFALDRVAGYFIDFRAKTVSTTADTPELLGPAGLAQLALGFWERSLEGEDVGGAFAATCRLLEERAEARDGSLWWPYQVTVPKYGLTAPWYSALAQGQAASVFVRLHKITGDARHADLAAAALRPLLDPSSPLHVATSSGPALEEAPTDPPSLILNGWIYALWGLWDAAVGLESERARRAFDEGVRCLLDHVGAYDVGWWSRYSLFPHKLPDLAKPFYHRLHVDQLAALHALTEVDEFGRLSRRWAGYDRPGPRSRALVQKGVFVAFRGHPA